MFKPGDIVSVGPLMVEKLSATEWAIRTPAGDWTTVVEDLDAPAGYDGEQWAIDAALDAEQTADLAEMCG